MQNTPVCQKGSLPEAAQDASQRVAGGVPKKQKPLLRPFRCVFATVRERTRPLSALTQQLQQHRRQTSLFLSSPSWLLLPPSLSSAGTAAGFTNDFRQDFLPPRVEVPCPQVGHVRSLKRPARGRGFPPLLSFLLLAVVGASVVTTTSSGRPAASRNVRWVEPARLEEAARHARGSGGVAC